MSYYARIALVSVTLAVATLALVVFGPGAAPVTLAAQAPNGQEVPGGASIRTTFSRPVDRLSAEQSFRITPPAPGSFFWEDRTLTFRPSRPLSPETTYEVRFAEGLRDEAGEAITTDLGWSFRTRGARLLALRAAEGGGSELWLVTPDGTGARKLLNVSAGIGEVVMAADGTRALYVEPRDDRRSALLLLDLEGGTTRPLVDDTAASFAAPAWAPVGDFIAFERRAFTGEALGVPRIWLAQPDGTLLGPLTGGDGSDISYAPVWSPDGNSVAFLDGVSQVIKVYSFFTGGVVALPARSSERPAWLPDGTALIYSDAEIEPAGPRLRLRVVTLGAAAMARDITDGAGEDLTPAVAPGGEAVAFTRRDPESGATRIWLVASAGGPPRPLSATGPHQDIQPAWSPDGRLVAFVRLITQGPTQSRAVVIDPATGRESVVLEDVVQLVWAP